ncbi:MAG: TlpA disulfide reductase family protein [Hasllibacter sp.]
MNRRAALAAAGAAGLVAAGGLALWRRGGAGDVPRDGDMAGLRPALPEGALPAGAVPLSPRLTVVNFWATWCAPCREEMPSLARAHEVLSPEGIGVVLVASDRSPRAAIEGFLDRVGARGLPNVIDADGTLRAAAAAIGLPTTLILGPDGTEVARLPGTAEWDGPDALATLRALADTVS